MRELREKDEIDDAFLDENVLVASQDLNLWFALFVNYLASILFSIDLTFHQRKKFMHDVKMLFWDDPYLYRCFSNGIICCFLPKVYMLSVF